MGSIRWQSLTKEEYDALEITRPLTWDPIQLRTSAGVMTALALEPINRDTRGVFT